MTIKIVTDSTCDLPEEIIEQYGITVVPLYINIDGNGYLDGVDISRKGFYTRLPDIDPLPTTAAPGIDNFIEIYQRLEEDGAEQIISIHISENLSAVVDVARKAASQRSDLPVTVIDAQQISLGTGFPVLAAAKAAQQGLPLREILDVVEDHIRRTYVFAALDTMEYLRRSGRINSIVARLGSLLKIKPLMKMHIGVPSAERVRTRTRANQRLLQLIEEVGPLEHLALVHTNALEAAHALRNIAQHLFPSGEQIFEVNVTPVLGVHLGPGAAGFACVAK